jgi:hypothetical protein
MINNSKQYKQIIPLPVNAYLFFYLYVFVLFIIANILPVSTINYFLFLFFGITGIIILLVKFMYTISIEENKGMLSIIIPFKIALLKLKIKDIKIAEQLTIDALTYSGYGIRKSQAGCAYVFNKGTAIKLTMKNGKIFIISCADPQEIITCVTSLKKRRGGELLA